MALDKTEKQMLAVAAGVGVLYFGLLNPLLKWIGIKDNEQTATLDSEGKNPGSFWTVNFWRSVPRAQLLPRMQTEAMAKTLYDSFGVFNDNEEQAISVIKSVRYQTQISWLSDIFAQLYGQDLLTFLRGGSWPMDRLSDEDVYNLTAYIKKLPVS